MWDSAPRSWKLPQGADSPFPITFIGATGVSTAVSLLYRGQDLSLHLPSSQGGSLHCSPANTSHWSLLRGLGLTASLPLCLPTAPLQLWPARHEAAQFAAGARGAAKFKQTKALARKGTLLIIFKIFSQECGNKKAVTAGGKPLQQAKYSKLSSGRKSVPLNWIFLVLRKKKILLTEATEIEDN